MANGKPILCVDFDGVINSYTTGWRGIDVINDPPVDGAMAWLKAMLPHYDVQIYSSRSNEQRGIDAMRHYVAAHGGDELAAQIGWPTQKPSAFLSLDDRAVTFNGTFPTVEQIKQFKPWNKRGNPVGMA